MTAQEAATAVKFWAIEAGLVHKNRPVVAAAPTAEATAKVHAVLDPFSGEVRKRGFNYVTFDEALRTVTIFTNQAVPAKVKKTLPAALADADIKIEFHRGGVGFAGGPIPPPTAAGPYFLRNNAYACGSSIFVGNEIGVGTLGCLLRDAAGNMFGLSNNHVAGSCNYAESGLPILAPGALDVAPAHIHPFTIGTNFSILPMVAGHPTQVPVVDNTDIAIFKLNDPALVSSYQGTFYDTPVDIVPMGMGMIVEKVGRTTALTQGAVAGQVSGAEPVWYEGPVGIGKMQVYFDGFFVVQGGKTPFSEPGDSGSLVTTTIAGARKAVGILFAGIADTSISYVLPFGPIVAKLGLSVVGGHNA